MPAGHFLYAYKAEVVVIALFKGKYYMDKTFTGLGNVCNPLLSMSDADHGFVRIYLDSADLLQFNSPNLRGAFNASVNDIAYSKFLGQSADIKVGYFDAWLWTSYDDNYIT